MKIINVITLLKISLFYSLKRSFFDIYFLFKRKYKYKIIFIAGLPMSATTKVKNMCGLIPGYFTRFSTTPKKVAVRQDITNNTFLLCPKWSYTLFKTHLNPSDKNLEILEKNNVRKVIVTYRDLRDVAVARYYRLLKFPKQKNEPHFLETENQYTNISKTEGMNHCIEVVSKYFTKWIFGWIDISKKKKILFIFVNLKI